MQYDVWKYQIRFFQPYHCNTNLHHLSCIKIHIKLITLITNIVSAMKKKLPIAFALFVCPSQKQANGFSWNLILESITNLVDIFQLG